MRKQLSTYKFKRLAIESLKNGLRLHFDSIFLYKNKSYPTALQIATIAIEEIAKAKQIEHYYYSSITNNGFTNEDFEQKWLRLLYIHTEKQFSFIARELFDYSPQFIEFVKEGKLELQKQKATYVGLEKCKSKIDINSRISIPNRVKANEAKRIISLINDVLIEICKLRIVHEGYFDIKEMDDIVNVELLTKLETWNSKTKLKKIIKIK